MKPLRKRRKQASLLAECAETVNQTLEQAESQAMGITYDQRTDVRNAAEVIRHAEKRPRSPLTNDGFAPYRGFRVRPRK